MLELKPWLLKSVWHALVFKTGSTLDLLKATDCVLFTLCKPGRAL
jgi:hypothetical protein